MLRQSCFSKDCLTINYICLKNLKLKKRDKLCSMFYRTSWKAWKIFPWQQILVQHHVTAPSSSLTNKLYTLLTLFCPFYVFVFLKESLGLQPLTLKKHFGFFQTKIQCEPRSITLLFRKLHLIDVCDHSFIECCGTSGRLTSSVPLT